MNSKQILVIRNFPNDLSDSEKEEFLNHFHATSVKIIPSKKKTCVIHAKFDTEIKARSVLFRLHQLELFGVRLNVVFAKDKTVLSDPRIEKVAQVDNIKPSKLNLFNEFKLKLNAFNNSVNFNQPPPSHLKYSYPKPNFATINNIAHALATIPKFYTQVLHLMNRMNLPPPFSDIPDPPDLPEESQNAKKEEKHQSEDESELESDPDENKLKDNIIPMKRKAHQSKPVKRPKFIRPNTNVETHQPREKLNPSEIFEQNITKSSKTKNIEVNVKSDIDDLKKKNDFEEKTGHFGVFTKEASSKKEDSCGEKVDETTSDEKVISEKELLTNRISENDFEYLPAFKSYHAGVPSCRLYIKNLSKGVTENDLNFIFKRYYEGSVEKDKNLFNIRLLQEGRMKGQAFVTLQNIDLAQKAIKETNGFILKGKPMVVVFARSAKST